MKPTHGLPRELLQDLYRSNHDLRSTIYHHQVENYDRMAKKRESLVREERRDRFAAAALTGLLAADPKGVSGVGYEHLAKFAFETADAMIEHDEKKGTDDA